MKKALHTGILFMIAAILGFSTGCGPGSRPYSETLVLTVDDSRIYLDELMYHVMLAAMQGELYEAFTGADKDYWDMKNADGSTMREALKDMALENAVKYQLFYELASKEGYTLSQEEKASGKSKVENILKNMGLDQIESLGLTQEKLIDIQNKIALAVKYYDNYVSNLRVDEKAVLEELNPSDYKQYDIEYIYAGKADRAALAVLLTKAEKPRDITTLAKDPVLNSGKLSFLQGKNTFGEEENLEEAIIGMEAGEVSDIIETVNGYYIIKLTDNTSTQKYDAAVKEAIDAAKEEVFDIAYEALKKEHKIIIRKQALKNIDIDKIIINGA